MLLENLCENAFRKAIPIARPLFLNVGIPTGDRITSLPAHEH
jgi:hypothetical protein